jgi:hypothetical protein
MQQLYEIASHWESATEEQVNLFKQYIERIVGYSPKLMIQEERWLLGRVPSECVIFAVDVNDEICQIKDVLSLREDAGFVVPSNYDDISNAIRPLTKDRRNQMWAIMIEINAEFGITSNPDRYTSMDELLGPDNDNSC